MDFHSVDPKIAAFLKKRMAHFVPQKESQQSRWHWLLLVLFGWMTVATFSQQLLLLVAFLLIVTLIKGPGMMVWGIIYSFLVSLFPPIGLVLSLILLLLNMQTLVKNWRVSIVGGFFYGYPISIMLLRHFTHWDNNWFFSISLLFGLLIFHYLLMNIYTRYGNSRMIFWYILCIPFSIVAALLPTKMKQRIKLKKVGRS